MSISVRAALGATLLALLGAPAAAQMIGPDSFGNTVARATSQPFASIVGQPGTTKLSTNSATVVNDDQNFSAALGLPFPFYGANHTTATVSVNGWISFGGSLGTASGNLSLTGAFTGGVANRATIAPYWDDLYFATNIAGAGIFTQTRTAGATTQFVIEWNAVQYAPGTAESLTFQTVLSSNGVIEIRYLDTSGPSGSEDGQMATIGIRDLSGNANGRNLQWSFDGAGQAIGPNNVLTFMPVPEPSSLLLAGLATLGIGIRRRSRVK